MIPDNPINPDANPDFDGALRMWLASPSAESPIAWRCYITIGMVTVYYTAFLVPSSEMLGLKVALHEAKKAASDAP